jgi:hypothetical protein
MGRKNKEGGIREECRILALDEDDLTLAVFDRKRPIHIGPITPMNRRENVL